MLTYMRFIYVLLISSKALFNINLKNILKNFFLVMNAILSNYCLAFRFKKGLI